MEKFIRMIAICAGLCFAVNACAPASPAQPSAAPAASTITPQASAAAATSTPVSSPTEIPKPTVTPGSTKQKVTFKSGDLTMEGFLFKPNGTGPFPGVIWNHGSEQFPDRGPTFDSVAAIFVPAGYVVFAPVRRGHGESQGTYIADQVSQERKTKGDTAANQLMVDLMQTQQLDDQLAGLAYLKSLPYVDKERLAVTGCSYGGIQTVLAAERGAGYKAAVAMSPGAESWANNPLLQQRLTKAVSGINIPVFLLHPEKDVSVAPGYTLAQEFLRLKKAYSFKIYPPFGPDDEQGHCFGGAKGFHWWADDVLAFIGTALSPNANTSPRTSRPTAERITLKSDGLDLVGYVYKPTGPGPFPAVIWNHGSEADPEPNNEFDGILSVFVQAGYVAVAPVRRGQGGSKGTYIEDDFKQYSQAHGRDAGLQYIAQLFASTQLDDELAGLTYLKTLTYVDKNRLAVVGCSYGGIMTLLGAERGDGYKAAVAMSPAAESWAGNPYLQKRLVQAVDNIKIPTLIVHPAHDANLQPGYTLGPEFQKLAKPYGLQIFPPFGKAVEHCFAGGEPGESLNVWKQDVLSFLSNALH